MAASEDRHRGSRGGAGGLKAPQRTSDLVRRRGAIALCSLAATYRDSFRKWASPRRRCTPALQSISSAYGHLLAPSCPSAASALQPASMRILAISGSLRTESSNTALLRAAARIASPGTHVVVYDGLGALPPFNPDLDRDGDAPAPAVAALRREISASGGVIISSPEYAHGVPGVLKNALDWLVSYPEFAAKPVVLWNASAAGGEYAQASLIEILKTMSARVLVDDSLLAPFLRRKLGAGAALAGEEEQKVAASLAALVAAASRA